MIIYFPTKIRRWLSCNFYFVERRNDEIYLRASFVIFFTFQKNHFQTYLSRYTFFRIFCQIALFLSFMPLKGELIFGKGVNQYFYLTLNFSITNFLFFLILIYFCESYYCENILGKLYLGKTLIIKINKAFLQHGNFYTLKTQYIYWKTDYLIFIFNKNKNQFCHSLIILKMSNLLTKFTNFSKTSLFKKGW